MCMDTGATNGLQKNFGNVEKALKSFVTVEDDADAEEEEVSYQATTDMPSMSWSS